MATSGEAFAITVGLYSVVLVCIFVLFSVWRRLRITRKFYAPKRLHPEADHACPPPLSRSFGKWVHRVWRVGEGEVVAIAGVDAAMYLKVLRLGMELFLGVGLISLVVILPVNLTGGQVDQLMAAGTGVDPADLSPYMFWYNTSKGTADDSGKGESVNPPPIYDTSIPTAPPGTIWFRYLPGVPPLPPAPPGIDGWRYDESYSVIKYEFTDLDKTTMTNIPSQDPSLYAHAAVAWLVTAYTMWLLWRYCKTALRLRMYFLRTSPAGAASHTVLCTDIPGVVHGTMPDRLGWPLKLVPGPVKARATAQIQRFNHSSSGEGSSSSSPNANEGPSARTVTVEHLSGGSVARPATGNGSPQTPGSSVLGQNAAGYPSAPTASASPGTTTATGGTTATPTTTSPATAAATAGSAASAERGASAASSAAAAPAGIGPSPLGAREQGNEAVQGGGQQQQDAGEWRAPDRWAEACDSLDGGSKVEDVVESQFGAIYKDDLSHVHLVYDTSSVDPLMKEYTRVKGQAMDAVDDVLSRQFQGKPIKPRTSLVIGGRLGAWGRERYGVKPKKVNAFHHYRDYLQHLRGRVEEEQQRAVSRHFPAAFITFKRRTAQVVASHTLMSEDLSSWRCREAPRPDEVLWGSLGLRSWERSSRAMVMWVAFFLLCAFYLIPVTAVQALLSTNSLVSFINDIPIVSALVTGILPGLALKIFLALLPMLLEAMSRWGGALALSQVDLEVVSRFFIFQVITVFFGSFIAGTFANQFQQLIDDPGSIMTILGTAAPQTAIFFMTYLLLQALLTTPLSLLRLPGLVIFWIKYSLAGTQRAKQRAWSNQTFRYGSQLPDDTIAALLGLVFCLICPLITPIALIYFASKFLVRKYDLLYVHSEAYQSGGMAWLHVFNQFVTGLVIFQVVMISLLGIKEMVAAPFIVLPLPFLTLVFAYAAHATFWPPMRTLSLLGAAERDREESTTGLRTDVDEDVARHYVSPAFKLDEEEHASLIDQCDTLASAQDAHDYSRLESLRDLEAATTEGVEGASAQQEHASLLIMPTSTAAGGAGAAPAGSAADDPGTPPK